MFLDIMRTFASSLQMPVVVVLIALVCTMVVIIGMLVAEVFTERLEFKVSLPHLVDDLRHNPDTLDVIARSELLRRQRDALIELLSHPDIDEASRESLAVNLVAREQAHFDIRVKVTDTIAKVAPMLGLMGTLIPLGPGLIAIGEGDTEILSQSLLIAFDTTILGLVVAASALIVSVIRKTWYAKYMAAFETAAECTLQIANEQGRAKSAANSTTLNPSGVMQQQAMAQQQAVAQQQFAMQQQAVIRQQQAAVHRLAAEQQQATEQQRVMRQQTAAEQQAFARQRQASAASPQKLPQERGGYDQA